ncbi:acetaldehyde dehydrogenase (acetylating) [Caloramator sp. Dgby_cultured_2]|uniref:acetaldehyde dehydrogenase (acetylating) n=1 Tax=Caloramator sp. Dgby_cultured_2 TaxID=3029174 RepID=UPI00237D6AB0|nr:acetaldehyde dehydrogenase (acetylating) [Caloramator sp. Dgby_cultured_2]WDU82158.1 acetaldehyde dehydrogenase (acetylating) [Caloramator sp. Dgby_cultured_2]
MDRDLISIQEARDLIKRAKEAQLKLSRLSQKELDEIVKSMAEEAYKNSERLAEMAVLETGFGRYEDKIIKNKFASKTVYENIENVKTIGILRRDDEKKIIEIGVPVGVIAALIPSTNPTSTTIYKALIAIKSGNSIVFSPHPSAAKCILETAKILEEAAKRVGAPYGIIGCIENPTMEATSELMKHKDVALILATGGSAMVRAAYSSGKPALGVGPGNVPAFIERTADIPLAVKRIIESKTFDNGTICASEQAIVTEECIKEKVKNELIMQGGYFLNEEEARKVERVLVNPCGGLNPKIVGQPATKIAKMADIKIPDNVKVLIKEEEGVGREFPFSMEKLSPILAFYTEKNWEKACERCIEILNYGGLGHTLVIHSNNEEVIMEFAMKKPVSRLLVNTPASQGAIGATTNLQPALTLGCGSIGGSSTSDNVGPLHLINIRRIAYGVKEAKELFNEEFENVLDLDYLKN